MALMVTCLAIKPTLVLKFNLNRTLNTTPIIQPPPPTCNCKELLPLIMKTIQEKEEVPKFSLKFLANPTQILAFLNKYYLPIGAFVVVVLAIAIAKKFFNKPATKLTGKLALPMVEAWKDLLPNSKAFITLAKLVAKIIEKILELKGDDDKKE